MLVTAVQNGEVAAFEALFERHRRMVTGLAHRLLGDAADVDDVVQETFAEALAKVRNVREPQAFASWLASIVTAQVLGSLRRKRHRRRLDGAAIGTLPAAALGTRSPAPADVVSELRAVYMAMKRLPDEERVMLVLHRVEELTHDRIAELTGRSVATVKRRIERAEERLRRTGGREPE